MTVLDPIDESIFARFDSIVSWKSSQRMGRTSIRIGRDLLDLASDLSGVLFRDGLKKIPHTAGKLDTKHVVRGR